MKTAVKKTLKIVVGSFLFWPLAAGAQELAQSLAVASVGAAGAAQAAIQGNELETKTKNILNENREIQKTTGQQPETKYAKSQQYYAAETSGVSSDHVTPPLETGPKKNTSVDKNMPDKVPESVKGVIKRLNAETENVTLEDLNTAREAVAKLDMLIDIEKRLNDLTKLRQEREEQSISTMLPATALGMQNAPAPITTMFPQQNQMPIAPQPPFPVSSGEIEIKHIAGATGRYTAFIKTGDDKTKMVRVGDRLSDGSVVKEITSRGMVTEKGKERRSVQIKDTAVVFNGK